MRKSKQKQENKLQHRHRNKQKQKHKEKHKDRHKLFQGELAVEFHTQLLWWKIGLAKRSSN